MDPRALLPVPSCYPCGQRVKVFNGTVPCSNVTSFTDGTLAGADESPPPFPRLHIVVCGLLARPCSRPRVGQLLKSVKDGLYRKGRAARAPTAQELFL